MRRAYRALCRGQEFLGAVRARGHDVEDFGRRAVLLRAAGLKPGRGGRPRGQRLCQGCAAATADGIRGGGPEADLDLVGGQRGMMLSLRAQRSNPLGEQGWIASSQELLAMTISFNFLRTTNAVT